jgi:hypothetical protein
MNSEFWLIELTNKKGGSSKIGFQNWIINNDSSPINGEDNLAHIVPEFSSLKVRFTCDNPLNHSHKTQANLQTKCLNSLPFYFSTSKAEAGTLGRFL